jgi:hypothetical protein
MIADPGERQIGQRLVALVEMIEGHGVRARRDAALARQHHAFRLAGGARGVKDDRGVGAFACSDLGVDQGREIRIQFQRSAAVIDDVSDRVQIGMVVLAQAPRLVIDHLLELRDTFRNGENLIDLLLVLNGRETHLGMRQHISKLIRHRIGIDRHRNGAERLHGRDRPVKFRPVGADDRDGLAAFQSEPVQASGQRQHLVAHLRPRPGLPDAEILVAHCRPFAERARVAQEQLRKGIRRRGHVARHRCLP